MNSKERRLNEEKLITPLHETLSEEGKKKLEDILTFWDALKEKWAELRKKFWTKYDRDQFLLQLRYAEKKREELIKENHQKLEEIWFFTRWKKKQEKFIAEYLRALSHYEEIVESPKQEYKGISWEEVQESGFREWVTLNLEYSDIWLKWAEAIAQVELKEWVTLSLGSNKIWDDWAKALSKMELKEWVTLHLGYNEIWVEWAKALAKMELKEWVTLDLRDNGIWAEWAKALSKMELKEWVTLYLERNGIWAEWESILENWVADAKARGINCEVHF